MPTEKRARGAIGLTKLNNCLVIIGQAADILSAVTATRLLREKEKEKKMNVPFCHADYRLTGTAVWLLDICVKWNMRVWKFLQHQYSDENCPEVIVPVNKTQWYSPKTLSLSLCLSLSLSLSLPLSLSPSLSLSLLTSEHCNDFGTNCRCVGKWTCCARQLRKHPDHSRREPCQQCRDAPAGTGNWSSILTGVRAM